MFYMYSPKDNYQKLIAFSRYAITYFTQPPVLQLLSNDSSVRYFSINIITINFSKQTKTYQLYRPN